MKFMGACRKSLFTKVCCERQEVTQVSVNYKQDKPKESREGNGRGFPVPPSGDVSMKRHKGDGQWR